MRKIVIGLAVRDARDHSNFSAVFRKKPACFATRDEAASAKIGLYPASV
jgi:hypothetical protein